MINLLSSEHIQDLRAARVNVKLVGMLFYSLAIVAILGCIFAFAIWWCGEQQKQAELRVTHNLNQSGIYADTTSKANNFTSSLSNAKTLLSQQIKYSVLLTNIANALPEGVSLGSISLAPEVVGSKLELTAITSGYPQALAIQNQMKSSTIFKEVTLNVANCESTTCKASYSATLNPATSASEGIN